MNDEIERELWGEVRSWAHTRSGASLKLEVLHDTLSLAQAKPSLYDHLTGYVCDVVGLSAHERDLERLCWRLLRAPTYRWPPGTLALCTRHHSGYACTTDYMTWAEGALVAGWDTAALIDLICLDEPGLVLPDIMGAAQAALASVGCDVELVSAEQFELWHIDAFVERAHDGELSWQSALHQMNQRVLLRAQDPYGIDPWFALVQWLLGDPVFMTPAPTRSLEAHTLDAIEAWTRSWRARATTLAKGATS